MTKRLKRCNLKVSEILVDFIEKEALPNTGINKNQLDTVLMAEVPTGMWDSEIQDLKTAIEAQGVKLSMQCAYLHLITQNR